MGVRCHLDMEHGLLGLQETWNGGYTTYITCCIGRRHKLLHFSLEIPMAYEFNAFCYFVQNLMASFVICVHHHLLDTGR